MGTFVTESPGWRCCGIVVPKQGMSICVICEAVAGPASAPMLQQPQSMPHLHQQKPFLAFCMMGASLLCCMQVLGLNNGDQRSVDARPSDSIALAMRTEAPLFVSRTIARYAATPFIPSHLLSMLCWG